MIYGLIKIAALMVATIFVILPSSFQWIWGISCIIISAIFFLYIPEQKRISFAMVIALTLTFLLLQLVSNIFTKSINYHTIGLITFKIFCIGTITISLRYYFGIQGLQSLLTIMPQSAKLYILVLYKILRKLLQLNTMIIYQLQSRIDLHTFKKFLIPKYYSIAFITNEFFSLHSYYYGLLSRSLHYIPNFPIPLRLTQMDIISTLTIIGCTILTILLR